jgi:hypothetical protein
MNVEFGVDGRSLVSMDSTQRVNVPPGSARRCRWTSGRPVDHRRNAGTGAVGGPKTYHVGGSPSSTRISGVRRPGQPFRPVPLDSPASGIRPDRMQGATMRIDCTDGAAGDRLRERDQHAARTCPTSRPGIRVRRGMRHNRPRWSGPTARPGEPLHRHPGGRNALPAPVPRGMGQGGTRHGQRHRHHRVLRVGHDRIEGIFPTPLEGPGGSNNGTARCWHATTGDFSPDPEAWCPGIPTTARRQPGYYRVDLLIRRRVRTDRRAEVRGAPLPFREGGGRPGAGGHGPQPGGIPGGSIVLKGPDGAEGTGRYQ